MSRWRMPVISRQGISGWAALIAAETLPAASPITSRERIVAFWCNRLARKAASSRPSINPCASRAASNISRRRAASRWGSSAIDRFGFFQDHPAADEIPARLDRLALDEIDRAPEKPLQPLLQISEGRKIVLGGRLEGDEEVSIAAVRVEPGVARG